MGSSRTLACGRCIPDVEAAEADFVRQSGVQPINHILVLKERASHAATRG